MHSTCPTHLLSLALSQKIEYYVNKMLCCYTLIWHNNFCMSNVMFEVVVVLHAWWVQLAKLEFDNREIRILLNVNNRFIRRQQAYTLIKEKCHKWYFTEQPSVKIGQTKGYLSVIRNIHSKEIREIAINEYLHVTSENVSFQFNSDQKISCLNQLKSLDMGRLWADCCMLLLPGSFNNIWTFVTMI
jgi:hypothetical protein